MFSGYDINVHIVLKQKGCGVRLHCIISGKLSLIVVAVVVVVVPVSVPSMRLYENDYSWTEIPVTK